MKIVLHTLAALSFLFVAACAPSKPQQAGAAPAKTSPEKGPGLTSHSEFIPKGVIPPGTPAIKVALLLPLSGDSAAIGSSMLDAATLALYDAYLAAPSDQIKSQIILMPKDTGATPGEAVKAAKSAIDQGAAFMVGPLFSQSVNAVAPLARAKNIPILTFSNNRAVAGNGVYVFGLLPEQQVKRVADYAFLKNYQRVALLAPNDSYGQKVQATLSESYLKKGGLLSPTELYAPSAMNIDAAVSRLVTTYNNTPEERRFQAIFIADGGNQIKNIITSLKKTNLDFTKVKLIGASMWDDPELGKLPGLEGLWFASTPPYAQQDFERRFRAGYDYKPARLAGLSYDAITMLAKVSMNTGATTINTSALVDPKGYIGPANALFRLKPDGTNERRLALMEMTPDGFKIVEAALKFFNEKDDAEEEILEGAAVEQAPAAPGKPVPAAATPSQQ